ncbi:MAG: hypothetical protein AAFN92_06700, partial [Bacteroidota bacterium]
GRKGRMELLPLGEFATKQPMEPTYQSVADFVVLEKTPAGMISPLHLADSLDGIGQTVLTTLAPVDTTGNLDLRYEVVDSKAWAYLGFYLAAKLRAAVAYRRYQEGQNREDWELAVTELERGTDHWRTLVELTEPVYDPVPLTHNNRDENKPFHWSLVEEQVLAELTWLKAQ